MWQAQVFTLYPEVFPGPLSKGLYGKAMSKKLWDLKVVNIRDAAEDKHKTVDDTPYGCLLYTSPSPRDRTRSRMPSSA